MMSPDGKWVWNGQQWLPVAVHESLFPAYDKAAAAAAIDPVPMAQGTPQFAQMAAPMAPAVSSPAIVEPMSYTAKGAVPPWMPQGGGARSNYLYVGAAMLVVLIGIVFTIALTQSWLPFLRAGTADNIPAAAPTPTPQLPVRSEFALAARYVDSVVTPGTANLSTPFTDYGEACAGTLSLSCQDALGAADTELKRSIATLSGTPSPACISRQVARVASDLTAMQAAIQGGLKAFKDNNRNELLAAMNQQRTASKTFWSDVQAVSKAQATLCDGQQEGP